jgi:hypothetical protein
MPFILARPGAAGVLQGAGFQRQGQAFNLKTAVELAAKERKAHKENRIQG